MGLKPRKKHYYLYADLDVSWETVREPYEDDEWDRGDDTQYLHGVNVYRHEYGEYHKYCEKYNFDISPGNTVYVAIEEYSTGDTFGHTDSYFSERGIFGTLEEAEKFTETADVTCGYFDNHIEWHIKTAVIKGKPQRWY